MKICKLTVLDNDSSDWEMSTYKGDLIVRAEDDHKARLQASREFTIATQAKPGQATKHDPWLQKSIVACEPYSESDFSVQGTPSVLKKLND